MKMHREKVQRTTDDIIIMFTDEEEYFRKKFITEKLDSDWKCTICAQITKDTPYPHPALRVSICFNCLNSYQNAVFLINKDGTDKNCRWCTKPAKKYNCASCTVVFCKDCIERNFDSEFLRNRLVNVTEWNCFICDPKPLWRLRVACIQSIESNKSFSMEEEIETIDLLSQESREDHLSVSQQALPNSETHNEQFSSESFIVSPKKDPKPIAESDDDNDSLWKTQVQSVNNNNDEKTSKEEMSAEENKSLSVVFQETEKDFQYFAAVFSKRVLEFSQKFQSDNMNSYTRAEKLNNKVSEFCEKAIENLQNMKHNSQVRFQVWSNSVDSAKIQSSIKQSATICDNIPSNSTSPPKTYPKKTKNVVKKEPKDKKDVLHQPSTSQPTKRKTYTKRKLNLSLKSATLPEEQKTNTNCIDNEDSTDLIEINLLPKSTSTSKSEKTTEDETEQSNKSTNVDFVSSSETKAEEIQNSSEPNVEIKEEPEDDINSEVSNETIIRAVPTPADDQVSIKQEQDPEENIHAFDKQTISGEEEQQARIQRDFEEDHPITVSIENYLCEKTGEFCQSYKTGFDGIEDEDENSTNPDNIYTFSDDNSEDSNKTEDYDFNADFVDLTKNNKTENKSSDQQDKEVLLEASIKEEPNENTDEDNSKIKIEELSEEIIVKNQQEPSISTEKAPVEAEKAVSKEEEDSSDSNTETSESENEREAAFRALISDLSESGSSPSDTDTDSDDSNISNKESNGGKDTYESGYVRQLDIAEEIAKLHENNREVSDIENEIDSDSEERVSESSAREDSDDSDSDIDPAQDPKLLINSFVLLDRKFSMKPVVVLERIDKDIEEYYRRKDNIVGSTRASNNDSDVEIKRLIDLDSIHRKRNMISSSEDSDSDISQSRRKLRKKRVKKSSSICSKSSSSSSSSFHIDSDESFKSVKTEPSDDDFIFDLTQKDKDKDYMPNIDEDLLKDNVSMSEDEDDVVEVKQDKKEKKKGDKKSDEILITDEDEPEQSDEDVGKSDWRKDKLLRANLALSNSDTDTTNDSVANEILQKQEENYLKKVDKEKPKKNRSVEISSSDSGDDAILLSDGDTGDNSDSNDSDIQFIGLKRKHESDDEASHILNKKGRRNIREVLKDNELQEETKKADKLETERKERLTQKQKKLDTILSESQLSQEEVGFVLDIDEELKEPVVTVHYTLVPRLKEHQKKGIKFMWDGCFESVAELKRSSGTGCILAHCMGLGKTMQVVVLAHTLLTHENTNVKHVLIICPLSTVFNWRNEFEQTLKVCPKKIPIFDIRPDRQRNFSQKMFEVKRWKSEGGVLMLGYESFQSLVNLDKLNSIEESYKNVMLESLIDPGPDLVVCDEGHMLKNGKTIRFTSLSRIKTERRIILTGTPLQNNLIEYYYMVNFVKPHLLGTLDEYKNRFVNPILNGQYEDSNREDISLMKKRSHILHKKLETTVQRYEEAELAPYLPNKYDYVLYTQLTPLQIKLYEHYVQLLDSNTKKLFKNYHALNNIWTHPALLKIKYDKRKEPAKQKQRRYDEDFVVPALDPDNQDTIGVETEWFKDLLPEDILTNVSYGAKMEILFSVIKECEVVKEKLLVFSSSIDELDLIEIFLKQREGESWIKGVDYYRMDGTVVPEKRMKYCNDFNNERNERSRVFLVSHKVGGLGLNLTAANRVVLMDVSWNPAYDIQSVFRIYRFGQTKTCFIYRFVSMGTMEEVVYSRAVTKLAISCRVVDEHQIKRHFNSDDLQRMYRLTKDFGEPPTLALPLDRLLAKLWETHKPLLYKFCDHQSLLENLAHEELNEEEMKIAWEEFRNEVDREKENKEMANFNRHANHSIQQPQLPDTLNRMPYQPIAPKPAILRPQEFQLPNFSVDNNFRYKRPNQLPSQRDSIDRSYLQKLGYGSPFHKRIRSLLNAENAATSNNTSTPSTSVYNSFQNQNQTLLINKGPPFTSDISMPSTSGYIPLASTSTSTNFPAVSTSVNPNFSTPNAPYIPINQNESRYFPKVPVNSVKRLVKNPMTTSGYPSASGSTLNAQNAPNPSINQNGYYPNVTRQVPNMEEANSKVSQIKNPVSMQVPNSQVYHNPYSGGSTIRKYKPSGQKENVLQDFEKSIENLSLNGVSVLSKNGSPNKINAHQNLTPLVQNYSSK